MHIPSYGLYCDDKSADMHGKVKYVIDGEGKAIQYSEYSVSRGVYYLPFISTGLDIPEVSICVNGNAVTKQLCYGGIYRYDSEYVFYPCDLDESITGTLYTLKTEDTSFTVHGVKSGNQNLIHLYPTSLTGESTRDSFTYTLSGAVPDAEYKIFIVNGDFSEFETSAQVISQTLSFKAFIDGCYGERQKDIDIKFFYSLANYMLDRGVDFDYFDFFLDSVVQMRYNAYRIEAESPCTVTYSMPVSVQTNADFKPAIYMAEQNSTCPIEYTVEINGSLPHIIESGTEMQREGKTYTALSEGGNFYFVFSASKKPKSIFEQDSNVWKIALILAACGVLLLSAGLGLFLYLRKK